MVKYHAMGRIVLRKEKIKPSSCASFSMFGQRGVWLVVRGWLFVVGCGERGTGNLELGTWNFELRTQNFELRTLNSEL
jgi:hypothetical protein